MVVPKKRVGEDHELELNTQTLLSGEGLKWGGKLRETPRQGNQV